MKILYRFCCLVSALSVLFMCLAGGFAVSAEEPEQHYVSSVDSQKYKQHEPSADELASGWGTENCSVCHLLDSEEVTTMTEERYYSLCPYHQDQSALFPEFRYRPAGEVNAEIQAGRDRMRMAQAGPDLGSLGNYTESNVDKQIFESNPTYNFANRFGSLICIQLTSGWYDAEALNNVMVINMGDHTRFNILPGAGGYDYFLNKQVQCCMNLKYDNASLTQGGTVRTYGTFITPGPITTFYFGLGFGSRAAFNGNVNVKNWVTNVSYTDYPARHGGSSATSESIISDPIGAVTAPSDVGVKNYNTFCLTLPAPSLIYSYSSDTSITLYSFGNYKIYNKSPEDILGAITNFFGNFFTWLGNALSPILSAIGNIVSPILDGIVNVLKSLFIPADNYFPDKLEVMKAFFAEHLGFIYTSVDLLISIFQRFTTISMVDPMLDLPEIKVFGYTIWSSNSFHFNTFYNNNLELKQLRNYFYIASDFLCYYGLLRLILKKSKELFSQ